MRGGRWHNLTSTLKKRTEAYFHTWLDNGALVFDQHSQDCRLSGNRKNMDDNARATPISSKLEEGNITAAVRILCSNDKSAPINAETLEELRLKHPSPSVNHQPLLPPPTAIHLQVTEAEVTSRVCTFPAGSSGGPDACRHSVPDFRHTGFLGFIIGSIIMNIHDQ